MGLINESESKMEYTKDTPYKDLALRILELEQIIADKEADLKPFKQELLELKNTIIPAKMEEEDISTINLKGIGRLTVSNKMSVSVPQSKQHLLREWMRNNGYDELVTETINSSTLRSWVKERIEEADEYPADLITMSSFSQASLTKK